MKYQVHKEGLNVASAKKWLTRHKYSKLAIKALGYIARLNDLSDEAVATKMKISLRTYREAKRELVFAGILEVYRLNANTMIYVIGDKAITNYSKAIKNKDSKRTVRKSLESIGMYEEVEIEDNTTIDLTDYTDIAQLKEIIPTPEPIYITDEVI